MDSNNKSLWDKIKEYLVLAYDKISQFIGGHKLETTFFLSFIFYLALIYSLFVYNPFEILDTSNKGFYIYTSIFGGFLLLIFYFFFQKKKNLVNNTDVSNISFLMKILSSIVIIGVIVGIILLILYLSSHGGFITDYLLYLINFAIFVTLIALIVKYFKLNPADYTNSDKPSWIKLLINSLLYIPCLLVNFSDYIKKEYYLAPRSSIIIIITLTILVILRFLIPYLVHLFVIGKGKQLLKNPIYTNKVTNLTTFQELNYKTHLDNDEKNINYNYAISSWIYLDSFPPSSNSSYEKFTSLLNIGNKPNLEVNIKKNVLRITMKTKDNKSSSNYKNRTVYKTRDIKYQKWNNFVVNYDGNILDVFLNNELVASVPGVIPYNDYDTVTCGSENGISGGICNIVYFNNSLSRNTIHMLYYASKHLNPPII